MRHCIVLLHLVWLFGGTLHADAPSLLWREIPESSIRPVGTPFNFPPLRRTYVLDYDKMKGALLSAPLERTSQARSSPLLIAIPTPEGTFSRFDPPGRV